jgi:hypothetical protein
LEQLGQSQCAEAAAGAEQKVAAIQSRFTAAARTKSGVEHERG